MHIRKRRIWGKREGRREKRREAGNHRGRTYVCVWERRETQHILY